MSYYTVAEHAEYLRSETPVYVMKVRHLLTDVPDEEKAIELTLWGIRDHSYLREEREDIFFYGPLPRRERTEMEVGGTLWDRLREIPKHRIVAPPMGAKWYLEECKQGE